MEMTRQGVERSWRGTNWREAKPANMKDGHSVAYGFRLIPVTRLSKVSAAVSAHTLMYLLSVHP